MKMYWAEGLNGGGIVQVWFAEGSYDLDENKGAFGYYFGEWLFENQIDYEITGHGCGHTVYRIKDDQQFVWLKLCIDERNIREKVDAFMDEKMKVKYYNESEIL